MFGRITRVALIAGIALAGATFAIACGDDGGELTLQEYFDKLQEIDDENQTRSEEIDQELEALGEEDFDKARDLLKEQADEFDRFVNEIEGLEPPAEAADAHDEAVEALRALVAEFKKANDAIEDADSFEDADAAFSEVDFSQFDRASEACRQLEAIAADNDITTDLNCDDEE